MLNKEYCKTFDYIQCSALAVLHYNITVSGLFSDICGVEYCITAEDSNLVSTSNHGVCQFGAPYQSPLYKVKCSHDYTQQ